MKRSISHIINHLRILIEELNIQGDHRSIKITTSGKCELLRLHGSSACHLKSPRHAHIPFKRMQEKYYRRIYLLKSSIFKN